MKASLAILDPTGHTSVEWDTVDKETVDRALREIEALEERQYLFAPANGGEVVRTLDPRNVEGEYVAFARFIGG